MCFITLAYNGEGKYHISNDHIFIVPIYYKLFYYIIQTHNINASITFERPDFLYPSIGGVKTSRVS